MHNETNEQEKWDRINKDKRKEIHWGESWKLATNLIAANAQGENLKANEVKVKKDIEEWQKYFFIKLQSNEPKPIDKSRKIELKDKARMSAEDNANESYNQFLQENN